jgi:hypothetical protein
MPCCVLALLTVLTPRVVLVLMFFFSNYLSRAYHGLLIPALGFFFLPLTTIVYAWLLNSHQPIQGIYLVLLIVVAVIDIGGIAGGYYSRRQRNLRQASTEMRLAGSAVLGGLVGGLVGYLIATPEGLSFSDVITRGAWLQGFKLLLQPAAAAAFNWMLAGAIVGIVGGLVIASLMKKVEATRARVGVSVLCPHCGAEIAKDMEYCGQCGKQAVAAPCRQCGTSVPSTERYCGKCGAKVT